jgi:hypothetical protein
MAHLPQIVSREVRADASPRVQEMCSLFLKGASAADIASRYGVQSPAVWKALRRGGIIADYQARNTSRRVASAPATPLATTAVQSAPVVRVFRDPCPRCGVRPDVGCRHGWAA